jgi:hypothetical protein
LLVPAAVEANMLLTQMTSAFNAGEMVDNEDIRKLDNELLELCNVLLALQWSVF